MCIKHTVKFSNVITTKSGAVRREDVRLRILLITMERTPVWDTGHSQPEGEKEKFNSKK